MISRRCSTVHECLPRESSPRYSSNTLALTPYLCLSPGQVYAEAEAGALGAAAGATVGTLLTGNNALGPIEWMAPEVLAGNLTDGHIATPASDVYMLGGLLFELLTCGMAPYYWVNATQRYCRRRRPAHEPFRADGARLVGLQVIAGGCNCAPSPVVVNFRRAVISFCSACCLRENCWFSALFVHGWMAALAPAVNDSPHRASVGLELPD